MQDQKNPLITKFFCKFFILSTPTNHLWKPTFAIKMVSVNGYGFPLKGYEFSLQGNGFPLHGNLWQNFKSCFQPKN
jgi:hypothetical protein